MSTVQSSPADRAVVLAEVTENVMQLIVNRLGRMGGSGSADVLSVTAMAHGIALALHEQEGGAAADAEGLVAATSQLARTGMVPEAGK